MTGSAKKRTEKREEEFQREQAGTSEQFGVQRTAQTLDPTAKSGLDFLINQATGLGDAPLAPGISPERRAALEAVGTGGGISPEALATIRGFAAGDGFERGEFTPGEFTPGEFTAGEFREGEFREGTGFTPAGRETLDRLIGSVGGRAAGRVADLFSLGGRGGSPASAEAVARGVGEATAPLEFGFEREEIARADRERERQEGRRDIFDVREAGRRDLFGARELERGDIFGAREAGRRDIFGAREAGRLDTFEARQEARQDASRIQQLGAAFGLAQVESAEDAAELQRQIARLEAAGQIDAAERERLEEPFRRLGLIADIVTPAASLLPGATEVTTAQTGATAGTAAGTSAGRTSGTEFGVSIPFF